MNEHLIIPAEIEALISQIENTPLLLAETPIQEHPLLPQFNRYIRVTDIDAKSENQFITFRYSQVLKDKETGKEINIKLPTPQWVIYNDAYSYLRNELNEPLKGTIKKESTETEDKIRVSSYKYMLWLMKNNKAGFLQLIQVYLQNFLSENTDQLNKL